MAEYRSIGPWIALTVDVATQLLAAALTLSYDGSLSMTIPAANQNGIGLLTNYQFSQENIRAHMRYGVRASCHRREMIYAQTSPALG